MQQYKVVDNGAIAYRCYHPSYLRSSTESAMDLGLFVCMSVQMRN